MGQILGWHEPGSTPTIKAFGENPAWLRDSTSHHEFVHLALEITTIHGAIHRELNVIVSRLPQNSHPALDAAIQKLHSSSDFLHEGAATTSELIYIEIMHPESAEVRFENLPFHYRHAVQTFMTIALEPNPFLKRYLVLAIASVCANTTLLDISKQKGLLHVLESEIENDWSLSPDKRLAQIARLPLEALQTLVQFTRIKLMQHIGEDFETVIRADQNTVGAIYDRAVEKWVKELGLFPVGERIGHKHRLDMLSDVINEMRMQLGIGRDRVIRESRRTHPVQEVVQHGYSRKPDKLEVWRLDGIDGYQHFVESVASDFPEFLLTCTWCEGDEVPVDGPGIMLTAITGEVLTDASGRRVVVWDPEDFASVIMEFESASLTSFDFSQIPITLDIKAYLAAGKDKVAYLENAFQMLLVFIPGYSFKFVQAIQKRWGGIASVDLYSTDYIGPIVCVITLEQNEAKFTVFLTSASLNDLRMNLANTTSTVVVGEPKDLDPLWISRLWPVLYGPPSELYFKGRLE